MSNIYNQYASQLQSRLAKRSAKITENEMWEAGFRYLGRRQQVKETKLYLKQLRADQGMDKKLLHLVQNMAWQLQENDKFFNELVEF